MYRLVFFLLALGLLAAQNPTGSAFLQAALSSDPADSGESPDRGWEIDPDGLTSSSQETPDRGWEIDANG